MGVKGLWQLLQPVGRPVTLESLEGKVLSVDASILLNQAVKGMRDKSGNPLPNAHLVVLFNRLCKLLFYRIKPIFIFDGGVPILKKKTLAVRRERKFKARHGSNKATEKMVKNYLKGKALETVTGKKSMKTILKNDSQRDPDIYELPPINQESRQESSSSEAEGDDGIEQFYSQQDFEKKFQDPSSINVDSHDFRSLPEEVQHELIKDVMEERKWTTIQSMPQDSFGFSDYQLQNVLQRGKLHQRLDELRKEMNNRNNGEVSGLSSQQDALGTESSVLSQRIVSEDSGHYVLIKTSKNGSNENQDTPMVNSLSEGGFFLEDQKAPPQQTKRIIPSRVPSFEVDLTCEAASSDSEVDVPLLDVPEVVVLDLDEPDAKRGDGEGEERNAKAEDGGRKDMVEDSLQDQSAGVFKKNYNEVLQVEAKKGDRNSKDNISVKDDGLDQENEITVEETLYELSLNKEETEECDFIQARIELRRNQIEMLLNKRQSASHLSTCEEVCEKNVRGDESSPITSSAGEDIAAPVTNKGTLPVEDGGIEFRLRLESSSDEEEEDEIPTRDRKGTGKIDPMKEVEGIQETQHDDQENFKVKEDLEKDSPDVTGEKEDVQVIDHQHDRDEKVKESTIEEEEGMEIEEISCAREESLVPDEKPTEVETRSSLVQAPSEFAGTSKEDLRVMQVSLEVEHQSLQTERARQERLAATVSNEMLTECQELLRLFGVPYLVSPMEAEAQCAFLDFTQQTNGSITDDSDVFLFGGTKVYKNIFNQNKHAELYTIDAITGHLALDRSKMIKLAFITGSDYTEGIQGLGAVGAMEVLHEFSSEGFEALIKFKKWHEETKKNRNSTQETNVKKKLRKLTLPTGFPSQEVFDSYVNPVIDESREAFEWGKPDLHGLRLFAKEKLGWSVEKTDEILLPVLKQLNKQESQMRMEDFFQIKFHEPKKKSSTRVRRVINRFLNPLSSSDSSSEDEGKPPVGLQSNITKGRVKETGSRNKMTVSRVARGRGRGQSRGRRVNDGSSVNDRPIVSNDQMESVTMKDSDAGGVEGRGSALVGGKPKKEGRKIGKRNMVGKGKISNQEQHMRDKGKGSMTDKVDVNALEKDNDMIKSYFKTQGEHNDKDKPNNLSFNLKKNENNVSMLQRNNVKNMRYKIPKKISTTKKDQSVSSSLGNENEDSSTSSDSDSEGAHSNCPSSANLSRMNKNGGRGMGRKRTRGRGRGRGAGAVKRSKIEKMS